MSAIRFYNILVSVLTNKLETLPHLALADVVKPPFDIKELEVTLVDGRVWLGYLRDHRLDDAVPTL